MRSNSGELGNGRQIHEQVVVSNRVKCTERELLKERAYDELKQFIQNGTFEPGTFLSERKLAAALGMSKTPVRSALDRLNAEGVVSISPRQGVIVRQLPLHEIADVYEIRAVLETFVLTELAGRLTTEQVARVNANLDIQASAFHHEDFTLFTTTDADFHILFAEFLGNQEIVRSMLQLREKLYRTALRVNHTRGRMESTYFEHRRIFEAVVDGCKHIAAEELIEHLEVGKQMLLMR